LSSAPTTSADHSFLFVFLKIPFRPARNQILDNVAKPVAILRPVLLPLRQTALKTIATLPPLFAHADGPCRLNPVIASGEAVYIAGGFIGR
jgi:hypothetical protein